MSRPLRTVVPPRDPKGRREGFTTGACAAAAAKAAARALLRNETMETIETTLPNGRRQTFTLERCELVADRAVSSVVKDAGDDPDCTHGAEIVAEVAWGGAAGVELRGGEGVAVVTKPGLGLDVGSPAINPVPQRNIRDMVMAELASAAVPTERGVVVTFSVPGGEEMAKQTINARLGLLGGISILGTTGIVKPYSTAAYKASVVQAIDVAARRGERQVVLTTGGKSETYAMRLFPRLPEDVFIQVGDFVGVGIRHAARRRIQRAIVVGMIGKLSKMADGRMMTHAAGSEVNMELLAQIARRAGGPEALAERILAANTARHVLDLTSADLPGFTTAICDLVVEQLEGHAASAGALSVHAVLVDFEGNVTGRSPPENVCPTPEIS
jgi:cobalt-precorrin-5B (C1)-methyltransferase